MKTITLDDGTEVTLEAVRTALKAKNVYIRDAQDEFLEAALRRVEELEAVLDQIEEDGLPDDTFNERRMP